MTSRHALISSPDAPENLSALARRRALSESEERRLELCLAASAVLRAMHQTGEAFDEIEPIPGVDDALVARVASRASEKFRDPGPIPAKRRALRWSAWLAAAVVLLVAAASVASFRLHGSLTRPTSPIRAAVAPTPIPSPDTTGPGANITDTTTVSPSATSAPQAAAASTPPAEVPGGPKRALPRLAGKPQVSTAPSELEARPSAPGLFSAANRARGHRDLPGALSLYGRLQADFPNSDEALLSYVLAARIRLGRGELGPALRLFDQYLARAPSGTLAEEALHGKAETLARLGLNAEERAVCRELLQRFPSSVYAERARERLGGVPSN